MKESINISNEVEINKILEREFSFENLRAYARACEDIGIELAEILEENKGKTPILLPSRGAIPVFIGACFSLEELGMLDKIDLPPLTCFDYLREKAGRAEQIQGSRAPVLIFPFTADVNLDNLVADSDEQLEIIGNMRRFGARAVLEFFKPPKKRNGLEYQLFLTFLEVVEGRKGIIEFYKKFPQINRLAIIDTVISGRASWTILNEWEKNGKRIGAIKDGGAIEPILVVDENGRKVKEKFGKYIHGCSFCQRIPRILTEDRGAALEGIVAVVYPQLILAAHEKEDLYPQGYPLFGSWHSIPRRFRNNYLSIFNEFLATIEKVMMNNGDFEKSRENFLRGLSNTGWFSMRSPLANGKDLDLPFVPHKIQETSSRVDQIFYDESVVFDIIMEIIRKMGR